MPLNHELGEPSPEILSPFRVVKTDKWKHTHFHEVACINAAQAFMAAGALYPILFGEGDILVQEYPRINKLEYVFSKGIAGVEHFYRWVFDIPEDLIGELKAAGRWDDELVN